MVTGSVFRHGSITYAFIVIYFYAIVPDYYGECFNSTCPDADFSLMDVPTTF